MSVKKLLLLSVASIAALGSTAALAGGPDNVALAAENGMYVEGAMGYDISNWINASNLTNGVVAIKNRNGGFTAGVDLGYQWNENWAVEFGWYYLPTIRLQTNTTSTLGAGLDGNVNQWAAYGALKMMVPFGFIPGMDLFFKTGAGYQYLRASGAATSVSPFTMFKWSPYFGFGGQYDFGTNFIINAQYQRFAGGRFLGDISGSNVNGNGVPSSNLFTLGVGYLFAI